MESTETLLIRIAALNKQIENLKQAVGQPKETASPLDHDKTETIFKAVFEASKLGNKIINRDLEIIDVNTALVSLLGFSDKDQLIGRKIIDFSPEDHRPDWKILQEKLWLQTMPSFSLETCLQKQDGAIIWCRITSILFTDKKVTLGYTIIEDITEQHNLRMQKEQFIGVASHELKTPVTSLKIISQLLTRQLPVGTQINQKQHDLLTASDRQATRLSRLVDDLLSTTKLEQGQLSLNRSITPISEILDAVLGDLQLSIRKNVVFQGEPNHKVFCDSDKIEQVLVNLISNAVKYAPLSHEIIVKTEILEGLTRISVIDHGPGIPPESVPKLFDRYYRVNEDSFSSGLGLGLYISAEIIRRHGGHIGVDSVLGQGSNFWITLPDWLDGHSM